MNLVIGQHDYGYSSLTFSRSLENATGQVSFQGFEARSVGEQLTVERDGRPWFRGAIEQRRGTAERGFSYGARSRAVGLAINDAVGNELYENAPARQIVATLAARAQVEVGEVAEATVNRYRLRRGQSFQAALQEVGAAHEFVLTDDAEGRVRGFQVTNQNPTAEVNLGVSGVLDIEIRGDISEWRDEILCRGQRVAAVEDVDNVLGGEVVADTIVGQTRPSRRVLPNRSARTRAAAAVLVAQEGRKRLASSVQAVITASETSLDTGDIVRVTRPGEFDETMVVSSLTWTISTQRSQVELVCVLPAVYAPGGIVPPALLTGALP